VAPGVALPASPSHGVSLDDPFGRPGREIRPQGGAASASPCTPNRRLGKRRSLGSHEILRVQQPGNRTRISASFRHIPPPSGPSDPENKKPRNSLSYGALRELRELDLNQRPSGYEPDELPDCSIPRLKIGCSEGPVRSPRNGGPQAIFSLRQNPPVPPFRARRDPASRPGSPLLQDSRVRGDGTIYRPRGS
jgi:hypothetical protein